MLGSIVLYYAANKFSTRYSNIETGGGRRGGEFVQILYNCIEK